jgi:hypothetical protein
VSQLLAAGQPLLDGFKSASQKRKRGRRIQAVAPAAEGRFKWIRIVFRCWKDRVAYEENKYLAALARRGSPLNSVVLAATATTV